MQVGTTKDQGLYNKPSALAARTLIQYNTIQYNSCMMLENLVRMMEKMQGRL